MKNKLTNLSLISISFSMAFTAACTQMGTHSPQAVRAPSADGLTRGDFFLDSKLYYVEVGGWPADKVNNQALADGVKSPTSAAMKIYQIDPTNPAHCPSNLEPKDLLYQSNDFELGTSGNMTKWAPKSSYKFEFGDDNSRFLGMTALNLKSMWNDVANMREALAWKLFENAKVPASRHTYARFCLNGVYKGLYSVIEEVDKSFLKIHFPHRADGNLYKAAWITPQEGDIGPASLEYRGKGQGKDYCVNPDAKRRSYRLKSKHKDLSPSLKESLESCDDLATFIARLNKPVAADGKTPLAFESAEFETQMKEVFDVESFLRWAAVNSLMGAWDNYWATPANYHLYNGGQVANSKESLVTKPRFHWVPWDYDNTFGISFWSTQWQFADILDWPASTRSYYDGKKTSNLPLISNLLKNPKFRAYYLNYMETFTQEYFNEKWIQEYVDMLWQTIGHSTFLESDCASCLSHTGRQFNNDQVYWNGNQFNELKVGNATYLGIKHYVIMRHAEVLKQIKFYKAKYKIQ